MTSFEIDDPPVCSACAIHATCSIPKVGQFRGCRKFIDRRTLVLKIAKQYHAICKRLVQDQQKWMIAKPTQPYVEWNDLSPDQLKGRLFIAEQLLDHFHISPKD